MDASSPFSMHRFDREFKEWNPIHRELARHFAKSLSRHSRRRAEFQFIQDSLSFEEWKKEIGEDHEFFLCPLKRMGGMFVILDLPASFCSVLVTLLAGGKLRQDNQVVREMSRLDEVALRPVVEDFFKGLEECVSPKLAFQAQIDAIQREKSTSELSLKVGKEKLKRFSFFGSLDGQVDVSFSLLYPYSTLSALKL